MAFTNSFRMERVYFERLKSMIDILKPYLNTETDEKLKSILENSIDDNGAILLLYRNLGECWAELSDLIKKADEKIDSLNDKADKYHDELNERIDEVNNYIMGILREIEARLETVEQDLATLSRNIILDLERVNDEYTLSYKGDPVDFAQLAKWVSFPDNVLIRGVVNGEETVFHLREFDTDETSGVFEFYATGLIDNVVHEITVTVLPDDSVNVATEIQTMKEYSAGNGINIDQNTNEISNTGMIKPYNASQTSIYNTNVDFSENSNTNYEGHKTFFISLMNYINDVLECDGLILQCRNTKGSVVLLPLVQNGIHVFSVYSTCYLRVNNEIYYFVGGDMKAGLTVRETDYVYCQLPSNNINLDMLVEKLRRFADNNTISACELIFDVKMHIQKNGSVLSINNNIPNDLVNYTVDLYQRG